MAKKIIEHPLASPGGFPFIELSEIQRGNRMKSQLTEEVIACSPVDVSEGRGSYFNTVYEQNGCVFVRTMMGRSDREHDVWVYAADQTVELKRDDPNYRKAKDILRAAAKNLKSKL